MKKNLEKIGTAAAVKVAMKFHHEMIAAKVCVKCYEPNDLDASLACSKCVEERAAWYRKEAAMLAALANEEVSK